jgi:hypothetical protein
MRKYRLGQFMPTIFGQIFVFQRYLFFQKEKKFINDNYIL